MGNVSRTVKPRRKKEHWIKCPHCDKALNVEDAPRAKRSARAVFKTAILAALAEGPASPREIERRMGVKPHGCETANLLRVLERKGEVKLCGSVKAKTLRGVPTFVWELCSATDRETRAKRPQTIDRARPEHKTKPRGART